MPLIGTRGAASLIGFASAKGGFSSFSITLNASNVSRNGDSIATVNSWWSTVPSEANSVLLSRGIQTYTGYYAATLGADAKITITCGGAAGGRNTNGRQITGTTTLSSGTRLVFFAGKATNLLGSGQNQGAGGGASVVATHSGSTFTPLIIAAGGSASYDVRRQALTARPLALTSSAANTARNSYTSFSYPTSPGVGGVGRGATNSAQHGGAGWFTGAYNNNGAAEGPAALSTGATGGIGVNGGTDGGFGGGGGDWDQNSFGGGGGGYYGGFEAASSSVAELDTVYKGYTLLSGSFDDDLTGPLSYAAPGMVNVSDGGLFGNTSDSTTSTGGQVQIFFEEV